MTDFRGYLCWAPDTASATISTEAVNPSPAVFLATHTPLSIRRSRIKGRSLEDMDGAADEEAVLKDFLGRLPDTGTMLMPVVGDSGSGKSHLVRWVRERIPSSGNRRVIYLEKSQTSLKTVVHKLLEGAESTSLQKLKADVDSFSTGLDETGLARRLVNALNEALATTMPKDMSGPARALAGPRGLAVILQDPYIQEHLLAPGKYIPQLASQLLHNQSSDSPERPAGFTVDDLPLKLREIKQAAQISGRLLEKLLSTPALRTAAVDLLNQHLETAIQNASNLGAGRLQEAMLQVRQEYARQGKEIILLVEDFALVQGVQRELLDALTEAATREGRQRYARMRTLMAVTTGYFRDLPETVMTRVSAATTGYVYNLDLTYTKQDDGTETIASFVGRYLNAARLGREELERFNGQRVPNHCDGCPVRTPCHDSFGQSEEGYGLYPFNKPALVRMVHSVAPADKPWAFVPRATLSNVVRPILVDFPEEIAEGSFPGPRFGERFPVAGDDVALSSVAAELVNTYDSIDAERRKRILEFWGDAPSDPTELEPGILRSFGLQQLADEARQHSGARHKPTSARGTTGAESKKTHTSTPQSLQRKLDAIENWAIRNQPLQQGIAGELRGIVADTVFRRFAWTSPLMKELGKGEVTSAWPNSSVVVSIEGAGAENRPGTANAPIKFQRTTENSLFFQSLLLEREGIHGARAEDIRRLARIGETKARDLAGALERHLEIADDDLATGFRASLIGAALAGAAWPGMADTELLTAALDAGRTWKRGDEGLRTEPWRQLLGRHMQHRQALVDRLWIGLGVSQGTGAVQMIDAARALPLLRQAASNWTWSAEQSIPDWVKPAVLGFAGWDTHLEQQLKVLATTLGCVRRHVPNDVNGRDSVEAVQLALKEAEKVGLSPKGLGEKDRLNRLIDEAAKADWRVISALEKDLGKIASGDEGEAAAARVVAAARDRGTSPDVLEELLTEADRWLTSALSDAGARSDPAGDEASGQVRSVLDEWAALSGLEGETE